MARALRIEQPGAWYHVTGRGNERKDRTEITFSTWRANSHTLKALHAGSSAHDKPLLPGSCAREPPERLVVAVVRRIRASDAS